MKKFLLFFVLTILYFTFFISKGFAQKEVPDTVKTGIYVTSIHDIDFKQQEYTISFWIWLKYKNKDFDFFHNLEVPHSKSVATAFSTVDSSDDQVYLLMKMQCVMKDSWKINDFPFDRQNLRLSIENSQYDSKSLVFAPDTLGRHYDRFFTLIGWNIDSFKMSEGTRIYETTFGDPSLTVPHTEYSAFKVKIVITRSTMGLFWKMFLGMYVAFLIAYVCFYIHADGIDSRFGLSVGALFAVIGNKYIVDSALPESKTFTLVDTLHGITLFFILAVIMATAYSMNLAKKGKLKQANRFDMIAAQILLLIYLILNIYYISIATSH